MEDWSWIDKGNIGEEESEKRRGGTLIPLKRRVSKPWKK